MIRPGHEEDGVLEQLTAYAAQWTGFSRDAILPEAMRRAARLLLAEFGSTAVVLHKAGGRDPSVIKALWQAVSVGETFFFRHPEHFQYLADVFIPEHVKMGHKQVRAWSAGCASGEETYSVAACLLDTMPGGAQAVSVLGTDLLERNLAVARAGIYGNWSRRPSGPLLYPVYKPDGVDRVRVTDRVRACTGFRQHNLLEPLGDAPLFDIIFCRNVLVYFAPQSIQVAVAHLARALAPGGVLLFSSMDIADVPPGLISAGLPEQQIFRKPDPARQQEKKREPTKPAAPALSNAAPAAPRVRPPEPVALHLRALVHIERGERQVAEKALAELCARVPDYVPGILERALVHVRKGERSAATTLMREVLRRTDKLPADELLPGPEPLPVSFYRESAQNFLRAGQGGVA